MPKKATPTTAAATAAFELERSLRIGEQAETITVDLDDAEVEMERAKVMDLLGRRDHLQQARSSTNAGYKARIADVDKMIAEARNAATTGKRDLEVTVEEWLRGSQVFRIRADTGEVLGQRAATGGERQELMFADPPKPADRFPGDAFGDATT